MLQNFILQLISNSKIYRKVKYLIPVKNRSYLSLFPILAHVLKIPNLFNILSKQKFWFYQSKNYTLSKRKFKQTSQKIYKQKFLQYILYLAKTETCENNFLKSLIYNWQQKKKHQSVFICEAVLFFHTIQYFFSILNQSWFFIFQEKFISFATILLLFVFIFFRKTIQKII